MFSWRRRPSSVSKERSIPVPLKPGTSTAQLKNSSSPQPCEPTHQAVPEFSRSSSKKSVASLRKLVSSSQSGEQEPKASPDSFPAEATTSQPPMARQPATDSKSPNKSGTVASAEPSRGSEPSNGAESTNISQSSAAAPPTEPPLPSPGKQRSSGAEHPPSGPLEQPPTDAHVTSNGPWIWSFFRAASDPVKPVAAPAPAQKLPPPETNSTPHGKTLGFWTRSSDSIKSTASDQSAEPKPAPAQSAPPPQKRAKTANPSLVLPSFDSVAWPSARTRLASLLWAAAAPSLVRRSAVRPKRAVVIGVHGYFPARMTRRILGEPTGTSVKFANEAEQRLRRWHQAHGGDPAGLQVDQIALEGEGKVGLRISMLYDLLMKWRDLLVKADMVFFAVHSQGAVVTASIIARLLADKLLTPSRQQVSVLAMAGSWLGPMPRMDETLVMKAITRIEHDSLLELFELQNPHRDVSQQLQEALTSVLRAGVKIVLVGSVDDQLIPLYSALALNVQHPNLFRAVYIDGEDVLPHVVAPLLHLALRQLNAGHSDHGVIVELSAALAGALTSKGHSKLYNHDGVYDLALEIALETQAVTGVDPQFHASFTIPRTANPYRLPWSVQALLHDKHRSRNLDKIVAELHEQFRTWKPQTKSMKDLKWRLAGLSTSKL